MKRYDMVIVVCSVLAVALCARLVAQTSRTTVAVTAKNGETVTVADVVMQYFYQTETSGIRVNEAGGETVVSWTRIKRIDVTAVSDSELQKRRVDGTGFPAEITLTDGKTVKVLLTNTKLAGKTDLGDYSISVDQLRSITPVPASSKK
jgi:hypothetical protein